MAKYRISQTAKEDLIRIHHYGVIRFGMAQADKYYNSLFDCFDILTERSYSFESVDCIKEGYWHCECGADSIYFKLKGNTVDIMAIIGRQDLNQII